MATEAQIRANRENAKKAGRKRGLASISAEKARAILSQMVQDEIEPIDIDAGKKITVRDKDGNIGYTDLDENFYQGIGDEFGIWPIELMSSILRPNHPGAFFFYTPEIVLAQAHELDTTLNDSRSRTKLYQIPFRPKTWPPRGLSDETRLKVKQIFDIHKYTVPQNYKWNKEDLIKILI